MKLQVTFGLSLLLGLVTFAGCYTQLGYYASSDFERKYRKTLAEEETEELADAASEKGEREHADVEESEGYYGRRKHTHRSTYVYPHRYYDTYWRPYAPYPYRYYSPVIPYASHPWFYGYALPYRYYGGYYPYTNVYRRYYGGSRYVPLSRRTYHRRDWRPENRRSRSSRSVTSPRLHRPTRHRNENK